jgi:Ca2+-transporting ATPase
VKKLQAVEALGQAQIIAVDKTGTITRNELVVQRVYASGNLFDVTGQGYVPSGVVKFEDRAITSVQREVLLAMAQAAALCANARVMFNEAQKQWKVAGDPTEAALLVFAEKLGIKKDVLEKSVEIRGRIPFDYTKKYQAVLYSQKSDTPQMVVVGAPEVVLSFCVKMQHGNDEKKITSEENEVLNDIFEKMSQDGLRVVACAMRSLKVTNDHVGYDDVHGLTFVGYFGIRDALRAEVPNAMHKAAAAGIRVVMITGDHRTTAEAIARDAGIFRAGDVLLTGDEVEAMSDKELTKKVGAVSVFARVNPGHKMRIITAFRARGEIIAMTGDGVNDAPSLVAADLGVAMGRIGTEVAKEAADIILLDDNFGSIVSAVEEGRSIYKTIKKVILYLFSTSVGEVLTISGALILGLPLPISAAQIIWLNLVTDGFLDMSLAMEPKEAGLLRERQDSSRRMLVDWKMFRRIVVMAVPMAVGTLFLFGDSIVSDPAKAGTIALSVLAAFQWFNAWNCRSDEKSIFQMSPFSNMWLIGATVVTVSLQMFAVYHPFMQRILKTVPLDTHDWTKIILVASSIVIVEELRKLFVRLWKKR